MMTERDLFAVGIGAKNAGHEAKWWVCTSGLPSAPRVGKRCGSGRERKEFIIIWKQ